MDYLLGSGALAVIMIICVVAFAFLARRILRIAIKLALIMTLVFAVLLTVGVGWWRGWFSSKPTVHQTNRAAPARQSR